MFLYITLSILLTFFYFCFQGNDKADFYDQISVFFRELILRLNDDSTYVLKATNAALTSITKNVPVEVLVENIEYIRNHMSSVVSDARRRKGGVGDGDFFMPAFNMPKGNLNNLPLLFSFIP